MDDTNIFGEALTPAEKPVMTFCGEQELNGNSFWTTGEGNHGAVVIGC
jgi:hypothetical protein